MKSNDMSVELVLLLKFPREVFHIAPPVPVTLAEGPQVASKPVCSHDFRGPGWSVTPSRFAPPLRRAGCLPPSRIVCKLMHKELHMATNLSLDPGLLERAVAVSGERTKKAAVTRALEEFIARRQQKRLIELMGKLEWDTSFDYKAERSRS